MSKLIAYINYAISYNSLHHNLRTKGLSKYKVYATITAWADEDPLIKLCLPITRIVSGSWDSFKLGA